MCAIRWRLTAVVYSRHALTSRCRRPLQQQQHMYGSSIAPQNKNKREITTDKHTYTNECMNERLRVAWQTDKQIGIVLVEFEQPNQLVAWAYQIFFQIYNFYCETDSVSALLQTSFFFFLFIYSMGWRYTFFCWSADKNLSKSKFIIDKTNLERSERKERDRAIE